MSTHKNRSIRNFLINPRLQLKLIFTALFICTLTQGCLLLFQYLSFNEVENMFVQNLPASQSCIYLLSDLKQTLYQSLAISFLISASLCFTVLLVFTHRIAGPIFKITKFFNEIADNPALDKEIQLRKSDYFQELAAAYNRKFDNKK